MEIPIQLWLEDPALHAEHVFAIRQWVQSVCREIFPDADFKVRSVDEDERIVIILYVVHVDWSKLLHGVRVLKAQVEERFQIHVRALAMFSLESPPFDHAPRLRGAWIPNWALDSTDFGRVMHDLEAVGVQEWFVLPFETPEDDEEQEYESTPPDEALRTRFERINGSAGQRSANVGFRVRLQPGARLGDYLRSAYGADNDEQGRLGGTAVLLTTLLQMNDLLPLVNHYAERIADALPLRLYSLSAMNLERSGGQGETFDIASQVRCGNIRISNVLLGERR